MMMKDILYLYHENKNINIFQIVVEKANSDCYPPTAASRKIQTYCNNKMTLHVSKNVMGLLKESLTPTTRRTRTLSSTSSSNKRKVYNKTSNCVRCIFKHLERAPCLLPMLFDILVRFGTYKIVVSRDIEKSFLNIAINKNDRNFLRFLWFDNVNGSNPDVIPYHYTRVLFGKNSSQLLLSVSPIKHLEQYKGSDPEFVDNFLKNLYVDDSIVQVETAKAELDFCFKAKSRLKAAGLNLRKWRSNDSSILLRISSYEQQVHSNTKGKIFGITWDTGHDEMLINITKQYEAGVNTKVTKKNVLKTIALYMTQMELFLL